MSGCWLSLIYVFNLSVSLSVPVTVGGAQAWASAGQPTLAARKKWPTPTTTKMGPTHQLLVPMRHHKGLQVLLTQRVVTFQA